MMDVLNTYSAIQDTDLQYQYNQNLLSDGDYRLVHEMFADTSSMAKKKGDYVKWHRFVTPSAATAALVEGENPDPTSITREEVTAQVQQYGAYTTFSDIVDLLDVDPILVSLGRVMGRHAALSLDTIARDIYQAGTSVYYGNNVAARGSVVTGIALSDLRSIERSLLDERAEYISNITTASQNYNTFSVDEAFYVIGHTDLKKDLNSTTLSNWIDRKDYADPGSAMKYEVGAAGNFRFILTTNATIHTDSGGTAVTNSLKYTTANTACDVYPLLIFARSAVGKVPLGGSSFENVINPVGSAGAGDPLHLYGTTGWKALSAWVILNQAWLYRYEVGVSE
jgi:N4-gp56 family major capsid protein